MKIIKEIEKSRLTENGMKRIKGGVGNGENCSSEAIYEACGRNYSYVPCAMKLSCDSQYFYCTGPEASQKESCLTGFWETCYKKYRE